MLQTILSVSTFFIPDVLLICSNGNIGTWKVALESVLRITPALCEMHIEVRNTNRMLSLGMAVAMRLHLLETMRQDSQRLRPHSSSLPDI